MGRRPHLGGHLVRLRLCDLVIDASQPLTGQAGRLSVAAHRPGPGRAGEGHLAPPSPAGWAGASLRQGQSIAVDSLHRPPGRGRGRSPRSAPARQLRQRVGRDGHGLYKAQLIRRRGPWKGLDEVEYATLEWVDWFNHRRLRNRSGTSRRPSLRPPTTEGRTPAALRHSRTRASGKPGAVHPHLGH